MVTVKGTPLSIGMKKGSPYTPFLNYQINKLRMAGILQGILTRHEIKLHCEGLNDEGLISISIEKVVFLFTILIVGGVISALILFIEKMIDANKCEQVEQHHILDQIREANDFYNSIVQHSNALKIEVENAHENLRRLQAQHEFSCE